MLASAFSLKTNLSQLLKAPKSHYAPLNGLRALSVLWVFAFHVIHIGADVFGTTEIIALQHPVVRFVLHGHYSVEVFFVISGFLIGSLLLEEQDRAGTINFKRFYWRRFVRLCPVYFLVMGTVITGQLVNPEQGTDLSYAWTNFLYVNNFAPIEHAFLGWTWTLAIEEHFYLVCPLLITLLPRRAAVPTLAALFVVGLGVRYAVLASADPPIRFVISPMIDREGFAHFYDAFYNKTHTRYGAILLGTMAAYGYRYTRLVQFLSERTWLSVAAFVVAFGGIAFCCQRFDYLDSHAASEIMFMTFERYIVAFCCTLLFVLSLCSRGVGAWFGRVLSHPVLFPFAQLSYSIYLIHSLVILVALLALKQEAPTPPSGLDLTLLGLKACVQTILMAACLYVFVEKPFMHMRGDTPKHARVPKVGTEVNQPRPADGPSAGPP